MRCKITKKSQFKGKGIIKFSQVNIRSKRVSEVVLIRDRGIKYYPQKKNHKIELS